MSATVIRFPLERRQPRVLVDIHGLQELYGMSERWWRQQRADGMPTHRFGARLRFDPVEVERWLKGRANGS